MEKELVMIAFMALSGILFALGGTTNKLWRRLGVPASVYGYLLYSGINPIISLVIGILLVVAMSLGYGETKPYWYKFLVACSYVAPSLLIGFTPWQIIVPVMFTTMFYLSNNKITEKYFKWKIVEFLIGVLIAVNYISLIP